MTSHYSLSFPHILGISSRAPAIKVNAGPPRSTLHFKKEKYSIFRDHLNYYQFFMFTIFKTKNTQGLGDGFTCQTVVNWKVILVHGNLLHIPLYCFCPILSYCSDKPERESVLLSRKGKYCGNNYSSSSPILNGRYFASGFDRSLLQDKCMHCFLALELVKVNHCCYISHLKFELVISYIIRVRYL